MNIALQSAEKWLSDLGIKTIARPSCLYVNRNDMVTATSAITLLAAYDEILAELKTTLNTKKLFWAGGDNEYLYLESF